MDQLTSMAVFVTAADAGSLVAAARHHRLSPSMAGKHVAALEADMGVRLMQRSTRSLVLTEAGRAYYVRAQRILEEVEDARRDVADLHGSVRGVLRIAGPLAFGDMHLGAVVASYIARYPDVQVEIALEDRFVDLLAEGIDLAVRVGRLPDSDLVARRLAPCRMVFCAAPSFLEGRGPVATVADLRKAPRLAFSNAVSQGDWTITDPTGRPQVIDGPVRMRANSMTMLLAAALSGAGVAYGPSFVFGRSIAAGRLVHVLPDHSSADLDLQAVYPSRRHLTTKLRTFLDHLVESFADVPPWERLSDPP